MVSLVSSISRAIKALEAAVGLPWSSSELFELLDDGEDDDRGGGVLLEVGGGGVAW